MKMSKIDHIHQRSLVGDEADQGDHHLLLAGDTHLHVGLPGLHRQAVVLGTDVARLQQLSFGGESHR